MYNKAKRLTTTIKDIWNGKNRTAISGLSSDLEGRTHPCHGLHRTHCGGLCRRRGPEDAGGRAGACVRRGQRQHDQEREVSHRAQHRQPERSGSCGRCGHRGGPPGTEAGGHRRRDAGGNESHPCLSGPDRDHGRACGQWRDLRHHRDGLEGRALGPSADRSLPHQHRPHGKGRCWTCPFTATRRKT